LRRSDLLFRRILVADDANLFGSGLEPGSILLAIIIDRAIAIGCETRAALFFDLAFVITYPIFSLGCTLASSPISLRAASAARFDVYSSISRLKTCSMISRRGRYLPASELGEPRFVGLAARPARAAETLRCCE
jgi:hypothetical protein